MKHIYSALLLVLFLFFHMTWVGMANVEEMTPSIEVQSEEIIEELSNDVQAETVSEHLDSYDLSDITQFWNAIIHEYGGYLPEAKQGDLKSFISQVQNGDYSAYFNGFIRYFFHEFTAQLSLLGTLLILTVFSVFLRMLQNTFEQSTVSKVAYFVVFAVLLILALNSFKLGLDVALEAVETMKDYIVALLPLIVGFMVSSGSIVSGAFFHPIITFLTNTSTVLMSHMILPLLLLSTVLLLISSLSDEYKVTKLAGFIRNISIGVLGIFLTVFLAVVSVQGAATSVADGVALRTAKFVAGNFIPVVGRIFTDATDTVVSATQILKNSIGLAGVLILLLIVSFPALKILVLALLYKLTAAILQPLNAGPIVKCVDELGKSTMYIFACVCMVSFMFFLTLAALVAASNIPLMIR